MNVRDVAPAFAALGDETRMHIVARLCTDGPLPIVRLAGDAHVSRQAVTKHLGRLAGAGLVRSERRGRERVWTIAPERFADVQAHLERISARWDDAIERLRAHVADAAPHGTAEPAISDRTAAHAPTMTPELASRFARIALGHLTREYPNKLDHVLRDAGDARSPRTLHPIFYGSFDWHSCVHGYWLLARLLRIVPSLPERDAICALFDAHITGANVAGELTYLREAERGTFERPYGWAWALALVAELARHGEERGRRWHATLAPLGAAFAQRFVAFLPRATYPVRAGTHANTAFALALAYEYAARCGDGALESAARERALRWYAHDAACPTWEPDGEDFLSPALVEAECMRRIMPRDAFSAWLRQFLPELAASRPATLFRPAAVSDRSDGRLAHLDGLNLSRAWCFRTLAAALDPSDALRARLTTAACAHLDAALPHLADDYAGEHWLATFATLALTADAAG